MDAKEKRAAAREALQQVARAVTAYEAQELAPDTET